MRDRSPRPAAIIAMAYSLVMTNALLYSSGQVVQLSCLIKNLMAKPFEIVAGISMVHGNT